MPNNLEEVFKKVDAVTQAAGQNVWLEKYKLPVYTELRRADEIEYAADVQLLNRPKEHYFALQDLGEASQDIAKQALSKVPFAALNAAVPGSAATMLLAKTPFMRGAFKSAADMTRLAAAGTLKQAGSLAVMAGMDTDTRLKRNGFLKEGEAATANETDRLAGEWQDKAAAELKAVFTGLAPADVERVKERLAALKTEQAKIDAFNKKVAAVVDNFTKRAGLDKTEKDGFWYDFGAGATSFLLSVGMLAATRNPAMVAPLFGLIEGQGTYEQAVEAGIEPEKAMLLGAANSAWITATELIGEGMLNKLLFTKGVLGKGAKRVLERVKGKSGKIQVLTAAGIGLAQGGGIEGAQEAVQSIGSDVINNLGGADEKTVEKMIEDALYAGALAFPLGGAAGGAGGGVNFARYAQNVKERLTDIGVPEPMAQRLAHETALEAVSSELVDDTVKSVSGEINSSLTAEDRNPQVFAAALTEAQRREITQNAWAVGERVEQQALQAGRPTQEAKASGEVAQSLANGIYRLAKLTPAEQENFKISILNADAANGQTAAKGTFAQAAAMCKSPHKEFAKFYEVAQNNAGGKQSYYPYTTAGGVTVDVLSDTIGHDNKHPEMTAEMWEMALGLLDKVKTYFLARPRYGQGTGVLLHLEENFGAEITVLPTGRIVLNTAFKSTEKGVAAWIKKENARMSAPLRRGQAPKTGDVISGRSPEHSLADIVQKIKGAEETFYQLSEAAYDKAGKADTNSPAFKEWFGDSKVLDGSGQPLVVYHGTNKQFTQFKINPLSKWLGKFGEGIYFTDNENAGRAYGEEIADGQNPAVTYPVYLSIQNPLVLKDFFHPLPKDMSGYDGIIVGEPGNREMVAFKPEQIKSVYNRGTWDAKNPNIFYQTDLPPSVNPEEITEVHNQVTGEVIPLQIHVQGRENETIKPIKMGKRQFAGLKGKEITRAAVRKKALGNNKNAVLRAKDGKEYTLSTSSVDKMYSSVFGRFAQATEIKKEMIAALADIFPQMERVVSHKDVKGLPREIERFAGIVQADGKEFYVMVTAKNGRVADAFVSALYDLQAEQKENANGPSRENPGHRLHIYSIGDLVRFVKGKIAKYNRGTWDAKNPNIFYQSQAEQEARAVDLTNAFEGIANLPAEQRSGKVEAALNALIGKPIDTATPPLQIQITEDNKVHIKNSNVKLKNGKLKRHQTALTTLEKIVNAAQKTDRKGEVDTSHNTSKKTLAHKAKVEEYVYFHAPVKIGEDTFLVELATERVKGQDKNLLDLYNVHVKRNPATAHLSTYGQGSSTNSIGNKEDFVKPRRFNQSPVRGEVKIDEDANEAIIRIFKNSDPSTIVHELAHVYLTMIYRAAQVSSDPEFMQFMADLDTWLGSPAGEAGYSSEQQEIFARAFEGYLAEGKAPNKELEGVFEKFARWLAEVYESVKDYLQITPQVRSIFDRLLAPAEPVRRSKVGDKLDAAKRLVEQMKKGNGLDVEGLSVGDVKELLKTLSQRKPDAPQDNLLKDLRKYGAQYANAGQIDKEAYKQARIYDKKGGAGDKPDVWLQKMGYMDFEASTDQTQAAAYDLIRRALDGENVYRLADKSRAEERAAYEANLSTILELFPDIPTARETMKSISRLEARGYRAVEKKDLEALRRTVWSLERMVDRLESEELKAKAGALDKKALKIDEDAKRLKKRIIAELNKRQLAHKEGMKKLLLAAKTPQEIHDAAQGVLEQLEKAWEATEEGQQERRKLDVPDTNWNAVRVMLLKKFNEIIGAAGAEVKEAQQTLACLQGRILSEAEAKAKEKAEAVLKKADLEGKYVRAQQDVLRGLPHLTYADIAKQTAYLAWSQQRNRLITQMNVERFIEAARNMQERNYKKYMTGKISALFSRKVFEKVGSARRMKYNPLAAKFLQKGAEIWKGMSVEKAQEEYAAAVESLDVNIPPDPFTALLNNCLALKAQGETASPRAFYDFYTTALAAVRGDAQNKRLEQLRKVVNEGKTRLAMALSLKLRKLPKGTVSYLLRGGVDFQTFCDIVFGEIELDTYKQSAGNKYISTDNVYDDLIRIHTEAGTVEQPPEKWFGTTIEEAKKALGFAEKKQIKIKTPLENVIINDEHLEHLVKENNPQRKEKLFYAVGALQSPNIVVETLEKGNTYRNYIKLYKGEKGIEPHLQIVKVKKDGSFYVTNYPPKKNQVARTIKEGRIVYDLSNDTPYTLNKSGNGDIPHITAEGYTRTNSIANNAADFKGTEKLNFRDILSPETQQMKAAVFNSQAQKQLVRAAMDAYGLKTADQLVSKIYELQNDKMKITNYGWMKDEQEGDVVEKIWHKANAYTNNRPRKQTISREELITFWLWDQDHELAEVEDASAPGGKRVEDLGLSGRLRRAYGNQQFDAMMEKLSPQDKQFGRNLQKMLADVHALESETHRRIYGFELPHKEHYFPSVTERMTDAIDYKQQIVDNAKAPSFIKKRVLSKRPVQAIVSPSQLVLHHMRRASEFIFEAEKYTELRRLILQSDTESAFKEKFGEQDGKAVYGKLKDLLTQQGPTPSKTADELFAVSNKLFNGWVKAVLGMKLMTGIKQFASCISFAEQMPAGQWAKWFAEGLSRPMETAGFMHRRSPYIQVRYETGGVNEAVARAMTQDEAAPLKTKWNNLTNLLLLNTRMGDKASLIYGGYPYMRYLTEVKKLSAGEAARQFELQAVRTLQSSLKANLSLGQANAENLAARFFLTFKNQQMQYVRRMADAYVQYANGEISLAQLGKTVFLYLVLNPVVYVALGLGWIAPNEEDREKDLYRLASAPVTQFFDAWPFGGGAADFLLENTYNVIRGEKLTAPMRAGLPMLDDFLRDVARAVKTVNADDVEATEFINAWMEFVKYFGIPYGTLANMVGGVKDLMTGSAPRGALKLAGYSKNRAEKITGTQEKKTKNKNIIRR